MARSRNIKPGFFRNADLADLPVEARLLFIGLWTLADREGRLEDRPKQIKMEIFPADSFDVDAMLGSLSSTDMVLRYEVGGKRYLHITNFLKHQMPHHKEVASQIPPPPGLPQETRHVYEVSGETRAAVFSRDGMACLRCGSIDGLSLDHIKPLGCGGDNSMSNLQTLCKSCNSSKGSATKDYRKFNVGSTLNQRNTNVEPTIVRVDALIPDTLIPDTLIPDTLIPETNTSAAGSSGVDEKPKKRAAVAASSFDAIGFLIDSGVEQQTAADYLTLRKSKKAPATKTALAAIVREIGIARMTPQAGVEMCCSRGWVGFKAEWIDSQHARAGPPKPAKFDPVAHINRNRTRSSETANVIDITAERLA